MNKNLNHKGASKRKGAAESEEIAEKGPVDGMDEGMAKKEGASRMGFTQNFGAARQNSYAKGAAKVASIMGKGSAQKKDPVSGTFGDAFQAAGGSNFSFQGKEYSGLTKEKAESQVTSGKSALADERNAYANPSENFARLGGYAQNFGYESGIRRQASINSINQGLSALGQPASEETIDPSFDVKSQQTFYQDRPSGYKGTDVEGGDYVHKNDPYSTPGFAFNASQESNDAAFAAVHSGKTKKINQGPSK